MPYKECNGVIRARYCPQAETSSNGHRSRQSEPKAPAGTLLYSQNDGSETMNREHLNAIIRRRRVPDIAKAVRDAAGVLVVNLIEITTLCVFVAAVLLWVSFFMGGY